MADASKAISAGFERHGYDLGYRHAVGGAGWLNFTSSTGKTDQAKVAANRT